jgi:hypothetical protein
MRDLYTLGRIPSLYPGRTEPDMRLELNNMFDGVFPEVAKSQPTILRKMRRTNGVLNKCTCITPNTQEPDRDNFCPFCHGEGSLWDEMWIDTYCVDTGSGASGALSDKMITPGIMNEPVVIFYLRSRVDITTDDRIVQVILDTEGLPVRPYRRKKLYRIGNLVDFRSDNGKLEYWKVETYSDRRKFLNGIER